MIEILGIILSSVSASIIVYVGNNRTQGSLIRKPFNQLMCFIIGLTGIGVSFYTGIPWGIISIASLFIVPGIIVPIFGIYTQVLYIPLLILFFTTIFLVIK